MKIYIYAIARNEEKFAARWVRSMAEADGIYVLDTGSTDETVGILRSLGCHVTEGRIEPWRFDAARNASMSLVPGDADVLVCTDLDEVFLPGWRTKLEAAWVSGSTTGRYEYVWSFEKDGSDGVKFLYEKIHAPRVCRWTHPVHEILEYTGEKRVCDIAGMRLEHHPDPTKSRDAYLPLLELGVRERPEDDRSRHYLGREYMFRGFWEKSIETLKGYLAMPTAVWTPERSASMRYIARCYGELKDSETQELWLFRAAAEAPELREAWYELGRLFYEQKRWRECRRVLTRCLDIRERALSYVSEPEAWGAMPWDLISLAWWNLGERVYAANCARVALTFGDDARIRGNLRVFEG